MEDFWTFIYLGVKFGVYPPLIFLGIGAMTDFGPLYQIQKYTSWCSSSNWYFHNIYLCPATWI